MDDIDEDDLVTGEAHCGQFLFPNEGQARTSALRDDSRGR